jgi:hypothetical protein
VKVFHRVSLNDEPNRREALRSLGISFKGSESPLLRMLWLDIDEAHPGWPRLQPLLREWEAGNIVRTEFSSSERANAKYLVVYPGWHHGYPQPDNDFGFLNATYDLKGYCYECGAGKKPVAPFRMNGEPKWGKKQVLQLNWVYDEYFVLPAIWEEVFRPLGIGRIPVVDHRTGNDLQTVVQLDIRLTADSALSVNDQNPYEICRSCNSKKYLPITHGSFPAFVRDPACQACRTQELFGSGNSASNAIVVGNLVYRAIQSHRVTGATFVPLNQ